MARVSRDDLAKVIEALDLHEVDTHVLKGDIPLKQQGLDSLDMMNLYFQIEEHFSIKISEESLAKGEWDSIAQILNKLNDNGV